MGLNREGMRILYTIASFNIIYIYIYIYIFMWMKIDINK